MTKLRRRPNVRSLAALIAALPAAFVATEAAAQQQVTGRINIQRFDPNPTGDTFFAVPGGNVDGDPQFRGGIYLDYARKPLVLVDTCPPESREGTTCNAQERGAVVKDQFFVHANVSLALLDILQLSLNVPVAFVNSGDSPVDVRGATQQIVSPDGVAVGDVRLGARLQLFPFGATSGPSPFELAVGSYLYLPTGQPEDYLGDGAVHALPHLSASGKIKWFTYSAMFGFQIRRKVENFVNVATGSELNFGAAAGVLALNDKLVIGPELYGSTIVVNANTGGNQQTGPFEGRSTSAELLGSVKYRVSDFVFGVGAGPGLTNGVGTPEFRVVGQLAFSPSADRDRDGDGIIDRDDACPDIPGVANKDPKKHGCPPDRDGDGIWDKDDACPDVPGLPNKDPRKHGCPPDRDGDGIYDKDDACPDVPGIPNPDPKKHGCPPDRDGDGIYDKDDACPDVPGVASPDPKKNGCPPDRDGDGIYDKDDACPDVPGVRSSDPKKNGCPPDRDGDGIPDDKDACPDTPGVPSEDPRKNGCPALAVRTKTSIKILQQVQFAFDSAQILPQSDLLLSEVAGILKDNPDIKRIRIEGHTDSKGGDAYNQKLSDKRAASVKTWLTSHGVEGGRLESQGFGETKPIASNDTDEGRLANRRVEFNILEQGTPQGGTTPAPGGKPATLPDPNKPLIKK